MNDEADITPSEDTFPLFHGFGSRAGSNAGSQAGSHAGNQANIPPVSQPGVSTFRCPLFNEEGVAEEDFAKAVVDHTSAEWRKLMTKYVRRVKVIQNDFTNMSRMRERPGDIRLEAIQRAMNECESLLDGILDTISDNSEAWYNEAGRTRSGQPTPEGLKSFLKVIESESIRVKSDYQEMMNPITAFLEGVLTSRPTTPVEPTTSTTSFSRFQPDKTLRPDFKIDQNSNYGSVYTDVNVKLRAYLNSGLVGCSQPGVDQIETHINLFCDEPTRVAYIRVKKERSEKTPPLQTENINGVLDCLLDVLLRRQAISTRRKNVLRIFLC